MSSLDQADAEDELASWLEDHGIENAWKLAATLSGIGFDEQTLELRQHEFPGNTLSDPLNWMAGPHLQCAAGRHHRRKRFPGHRPGRSGEEIRLRRQEAASELDVHDSIQSTLVILGHKFRQKELTVVKLFAPLFPRSPPVASA